MKKSTFNIVCYIAATVLLSCEVVSCSSEPTVGEKEAAIFREYTEKIRAAQTIEDIAQIQNESDYHERVSLLISEYEALIVNGDSSAFYAEMAKAQGAKDTLKMVTDKKLADLVTQIQLK